jgi:hypothetical protein
MTIQIEDKDRQGLVCVVVNGQCNHFDIEFEEMIFQGSAPWEDIIEEVEVCQKCRAWKDADYTWREQ